jgi:hypothetical protein
VAKRNASVVGGDREALIVGPGQHKIEGDARRPTLITGGTFQGVDVPLGELMVDERGRLVFVPAQGAGYSPSSTPLTTFSDNDGWVDDTCDGPVRATVRIGTRTLRAAPAWVVVTPPNYGPGMPAGLVTAYDSARPAWGQPDDPGPASFVDDILPIFTRIVDMQWVNAGFLASNGWGSPEDFLDPQLLDQLANPKRASDDLRTSLFERFRDPAYKRDEPDDIPQIYGDGVAIPAESQYQWLAVTPIQFRALRQWARGDFVDDRGDGRRVERVDDLPLAQRPAALDRAALESCLGGAYHPGIELPWTLRVPLMWESPGRLRSLGDVVVADEYGEELKPKATLAIGGPCSGSGPGDLTRWQGVPWQSDAGSCRSGYQPEISPVLPTFWPARIPNHVLREADYQKVMDTSLPIEERQAAFNARADWERFVLSPVHEETLANMMAGWWKLGLVRDRAGPDDGMFPEVMKVESDLGFPDPAP